jgi:hypothetical protein
MKQFLFSEKIKRLAAYEYAPVPLPWFLAQEVGKNKIASQIHRIFLQESATDRQFGGRKPVRKLKYIIYIALFTVFWPVLSGIRASEYLNKNGNYVQTYHQINLWMQWLQSFYLSAFYNIHPDSYYKFQLWEPANRKKIALYIQDYKIKTLLPYLNRNIDVEQVRDKVRFFEAASVAGLPIIPIIAKLDSFGKIKWYNPEEKFPQKNLFIKYTNLYCGQGAEYWEYVEANKWKSGDLMFDGAHLVEHCLQKAQYKTVIVQLNIQNHPSVANFSQGGLCTLRAITYKLPSQPAKSLISSWRMPRGEEKTDNFAGGGLVAGVSNEGILTAAVAKDIRLGSFTNHPDTNAQIQGTQLPRFQDMVNLALKAHECFQKPCFIGWDIALTMDGPTIVEANTTWGTESIEMPHRRPLMETEFGEIYCRALEQMEA